MRLFILGATGGTGRQLLDQALDRGAKVTAFARSPEKLGTSREGLIVRRGDPSNAAELTVSSAIARYIYLWLMRPDLLSERAERRAGELLAEVKMNKSRYHW